jgi:hypothetical protein
VSFQAEGGALEGVEEGAPPLTIQAHSQPP